MNMTIQLNGINKIYGNQHALKDINLDLKANRIYGLLGRNGAGKTTLLHLLTTQFFPSSGDIRINQQNPYENAELLKQICFVKESQPFRKHFRVRDILRLASAFYPNWDDAYAQRLVREFELDITKKLTALSRGMESAVGIIVGLASRAPLTIYDEPYLGLDAVARKIFYDRLIEDFGEHPRTIIMSTHLIDEVSKLLEHVMIIRQGRLVIDEEIDAVLERAFFINGHVDQLRSLEKDARILHIETLGAAAAASWFGPMSAVERASMQESGLEISRMPLQQLLVQLTTDRKEGVHA